MGMSIDYIGNVKVITERYVTFNDFLSGFYNLDIRVMGSGLMALYADDYIEFCKDNCVGVDSNFRVESYMTCLTPNGIEILEKVRELKQNILQSTDIEEKTFLVLQLRKLRLTDEHQKK